MAEPLTHLASGKILYRFLVFQYACQAALFAPLGSLRLGFRIMTFASSIVMLVSFPPGDAPNPFRRFAGWVFGIMVLGLLRPNLNSLLAGLAVIGMCAAIWGPTFWVGRIRVNPNSLADVILLMWMYHTVIAVFGVLQVYDPERFAPDPTFITSLYGEMADGLKIQLDDGSTKYLY